MDGFFRPLISGTILPGSTMQIFAMHLGWALVLSAIAAFLLRPFPKALRLTGISIVSAMHLLPGPWNPSWWLGLAFQSPSLTLQGMSLLYLYRIWHQRNIAPVESIHTAAHAAWPNSLLLIAALIGWIFTMDMLAQFDFQLYSLGFTRYATFTCLLLAVAFELYSPYARSSSAMNRYREVALIIVSSAAIHLVFRLPSGNAWDALIDPWLWLGAQAMLLFRAMTFIRLSMPTTTRRLTEWVASRI